MFVELSRLCGPLIKNTTFECFPHAAGNANLHLDFRMRVGRPCG
jgi:hypothetical protein